MKAEIENQVNRRGQRAVIYGHSMGTKVAAYFFTWLGSQMSETQRPRPRGNQSAGAPRHRRR